MPTQRSTAPGSNNPDPVGELRFLIDVGQIDGVSRPIGAFAECSGLQVEYEVLDYPEGGENGFTHKLRGRAKYPNLVLKRGITHEDGLLRWFAQCQEATKRHDVQVQLIGPDGKPVRKWGFRGAFPVKWQGPALNAKSTNVATETLEIAHQGFTPGV
jgi:phage tail-like protein